MKVRIPNKLSEITLEQYQKFSKIEQGSYFAQQKAVEIFCKVPLTKVAQMRHKDVSEIYTFLDKLMNTEPKSMTKRFDFDGKEFGFIPNFSEMTSGEYADLSAYLSDPKDYHRAMAVLYRPVYLKRGEKYLIEEYETSDKYAHTMLKLDCEHVFAAIFFFLRTLQVLKKDLARSLKRMSHSNPTLKKHLQKDTDGMQRFMESLDMIQQNSMPWQSSQLKV